MCKYGLEENKNDGHNYTIAEDCEGGNGGKCIVFFFIT